MGATGLDQNGSEGLERLLGSVAAAMADALGGLVGRALSVKPGKLAQTSRDQLLADLDAQHALVVGELDKDYAGQALRILLPSPDAATLSGLVRTEPEETILAHRSAGVLEDEELEAFAQVAQTLCAGIEALLRDSVGSDVAVHAGDHCVVQPGEDGEDQLAGASDLVQFSFPCTIEGYPESLVSILLQPETAERWSGVAAPPGVAGDGDADELQEDALEDIPAAEIRGKLATYLLDRRHLMSIRKSCRRVGLELDQHGQAEVPNPAAHREDIVLIEVPGNDSRRFDWCRRLKAFRSDATVVLLLRRPTRAQVVAGFMANADAIIGVPAAEPQISRKLRALLEPEEPTS